MRCYRACTSRRSGRTSRWPGQALLSFRRPAHRRGVGYSDGRVTRTAVASVVLATSRLQQVPRVLLFHLRRRSAPSALAGASSAQRSHRRASLGAGGIHRTLARSSPGRSAHCTPGSSSIPDSPHGRALAAFDLCWHRSRSLRFRDRRSSAPAQHPGSPQPHHTRATAEHPLRAGDRAPGSQGPHAADRRVRQAPPVRHRVRRRRAFRPQLQGDGQVRVRLDRRLSGTRDRMSPHATGRFGDLRRRRLSRGDRSGQQDQCWYDQN